MGDLILKLIDLGAHLIPFRIVRHWERGVYLVCGRYWRTVGPGLKLVVPFLCEVCRVPVVPEVYLTPLLSVTLRDGRALTFSASVTVVVTDAAKAFLELGHYAETVQEIAAAVLAEGLADADPRRFDPAHGKRDRLLADLRADVNAEIARYGLEVTAVRMNSFVLNPRTLRLLLDRAVLPQQPPAAP